MARLPQRPIQHEVDEVAVRYIEGTLPRSWIKEQIYYDYGIDLNVEIVKNTFVTGAHFIIQSKGTEVPKYKQSGHICYYDMKTSTLNYYLERSELVVFIVYDVKNNIAFWIWMKEYILQILDPKWRQQEKAKICIPTENVFDKNAISKIEEKVLLANEQSKILAAVQSVDNPYRSYIYSIQNNRPTIAMQEKYKGALKDHPINISGSFEFGKDKESQEAFTAFENAIKTGEPLIIDSRYIKDFDISAIAPELMHLFGDTKIKELQMSTAKTDERIPIKIEVLDENHIGIAEIPYTELSLSKAGTEEKTYSNEHQQIPFNVYWKVLYNEQFFSLSFSINCMGTRIIEIQKSISFLNSLNQGSYIHITFLRDGSTITQNIPQEDNIHLDEEFINTIDNLAIINEKAYLDIRFPEYFTYKDVELIKFLATIMLTGEYHSDNKFFSFSVPSDDAINIYQKFKENDNDSWVIIEQDSEENLFGTKISLGKRIISFEKCSLTEDTKNRIIELEKISDKQETIIITLNLYDQGITQRFDNWVPKV